MKIEAKIVYILLVLLINGIRCSALSLDPDTRQIGTRIAMTLSIDGLTQTERVIIGLFEKDCPKTTKNFKEIALNPHRSPISGAWMSYNECVFHRIIPNFMMQGGDFTKNNGTGGESIYGRSFADENLKIGHKKGVLAMANSGANTNGSQFYIPVGDASYLDGGYVVFGKVLDGMNLVDLIVKNYGNKTGKPKGVIKMESFEDVTQYYLQQEKEIAKQKMVPHKVKALKHEVDDTIIV